jgi:hypothetical protein
MVGEKSPFHSKPFRQESPERLEVDQAVMINPEGSNAKSESWGLEDLFERPQISRQTRMRNLMERKSTRRVENGAAQPTSISNKSANLAISSRYTPRRQAGFLAK